MTVEPGSALAALRNLEQESPRYAKDALKDAGRLFDNEMRQRFFKRTSNSDDHLQARTGNLRRSLGYEVSGSKLSDLRLAVYSAGTKYANIQENGGTVTPKRGKYLTIPLRDNLTPAGVPRYPSARDLRAQLGGVKGIKRGPRGSKDKLAGARTFILKSRSGKLFIVLQKGKGKPQFLWVLVKKATIPPRFGFRKTWNAQAKLRDELFVRAMNEAVDAAVRKARISEKKSEQEQAS